jgi:signal transduction protein with GAF and PtsI domain
MIVYVHAGLAEVHQGAYDMLVVSRACTVYIARKQERYKLYASKQANNKELRLKLCLHEGRYGQTDLQARYLQALKQACKNASKHAA